MYASHIDILGLGPVKMTQIIDVKFIDTDVLPFSFSTMRRRLMVRDAQLDFQGEVGRFFWEKSPSITEKKKLILNFSQAT